ncbi:diguanylate cyclase [Modestobacter sp. Leaf380]|uniref:GGDEF domain-containing protein n=1 Tax=Modestobacter sp. Leaf380 TaxID=1736356 RepID=UPI0006FE5F2D|nr:diguanylate cyclase [Modestobacter sp. Leaf380]KQS68883.1 diguanylate cyclase [Modestobacter sp. Leaf380]
MTTVVATTQDEAPPSPAGPDGHRVRQLQAVLDELEAVSRFDRALDVVSDRAREAGDTARSLGLTELELRAELVAVDVRRRAGHVAEAGRTAQDVHRWATDHDAPRLLARAHFMLAAVFQELGDLSLALEHAVLSVERLGEEAPAAVAIDHRVRMADCLGLQGDVAAQDMYLDVLGLAERQADVDRQLLILNNSAYTASLAGAHERALVASTRLQDLSHQHAVPLDVGRLDTVARVLVGLGRLDEAEAALRPGLAPEVLALSPDGDAGADFLLTHAEVQRERGRCVEAQASLDECVRRCEEHGLTSIRVRTRREQAELYAAGGDYRAAFEEHKAYCREVLELQSVQRDARARTLQAMYETTEARRQSRRYRELSLRDPLTGLYNRRHVDEALPHLLVRGAVEGALVTVALLDLDHFKRVNDTFSHEVGDEVLRRVARLLEGAVSTAAEGSFAARMGGEEFLLVFVGEGLTDTARRFEDVRRAVADHPWAGLTGTLPVTVSIGVASASGPTVPAPADLLGRADAHLYRAKSLGRDRVVGD